MGVSATGSPRLRHQVPVHIYGNIIIHNLDTALMRAAQHHLDARQKLHCLKRLYDIILRPQAQPLYLIRHILQRC